MTALPSSVVFLLVRSAPAIVDLAHRRGDRDTDAIRVDLETEGLALSRMRESKGRRATLFTIPTEHTASERTVLLFIDRWITQQEDPPTMYTDVFAGETATIAMRMAPPATPLSPTPTTIGHAQRDVSPCGNRGPHGRRRQDGHGGAMTISAPNSSDTTATQVTGPTRDRSVRPSWASEQDIQLGRPSDPCQTVLILRRHIAILTPEPDATDSATPGLATDPAATVAGSAAAQPTSAGGGDMDAAVRLLRESGMVRARIGADRRREGERDTRRTQSAAPRFRRRVVGDHLEYEPSA